MDLKLNFKLGQKTINGRMYDPNELMEQFNSVLKEKGKISVGPDNEHINKEDGSVPSEVLVGEANSFRVEEDGTVYFDVQGMTEQTEQWLQSNPDVMKLTLFGFGNIDEEKKVHDFKLGCLFMTQDQG